MRCADTHRQAQPLNIEIVNVRLSCSFQLEWGSESGQKDKKVTVRVQMQPAQLSMTVSSEDLGCEMASHSRCAIMKAHVYLTCRNNWRQVFPSEALIACNIDSDLEFSYRFSLLHMTLRALQQESSFLSIDAQIRCVQLCVRAC